MEANEWKHSVVGVGADSGSHQGKHGRVGAINGPSNKWKQAEKAKKKQPMEAISRVVEAECGCGSGENRE